MEIFSRPEQEVREVLSKGMPCSFFQIFISPNAHVTTTTQFGRQRGSNWPRFWIKSARVLRGSTQEALHRIVSRAYVRPAESATVCVDHSVCVACVIHYAAHRLHCRPYVGSRTVCSRLAFGAVQWRQHTAPSNPVSVLFFASSLSRSSFWFTAALKIAKHINRR